MATWSVMATVATVLGDRIALRFPWSPSAVERARSVVGARWNAKEKAWTYPLDMETCHRLREEWGKDLSVAVPLRDWYLGEKAKFDASRKIIELDITAGTDLERVPMMAPKIWNAMQNRGYQPIAVKFGSTVRNVLIADQPGLGKTIETLGTLIESGTTGRILVVAPRTSLRATWQPEIHKWLEDYKGDVSVTVVDAQIGSKKKREEAIYEYLENFRNEPACYDPNKLHFLVVNPEMLRARRLVGSGVEFKYKQFSHVTWDAVVVDESHRYLLNANPRAERCSQVGMGLGSLRAGQRIALSGTPMRGKPRKIWHTLRWLNPDLYPSEWSWSKMYFETAYSRWSPSGEEITDILREDRAEAFGRELSRVMIRRTKSEIREKNPQWAPPDKQFIEVWLPMGKRQADLYSQMESRAAVEVADVEVTANGVLAILTRLKQIATSAVDLSSGQFEPDMPSNKIEWLLDDFIPSRDNKIVVASQYAKVINLVSRELSSAGIAHYSLTGDTKDDLRRYMIESFQNPSNDVQVFLLTTTAGGVSVTLDAADDLVLLDETWVPDDQEQVEDRIHRTSRVDHQVNIYYVRSLGTLESDIAETVEAKDNSQKRVLDGARGIAWAKNKLQAKIKGE